MRGVLMRGVLMRAGEEIEDPDEEEGAEPMDVDGDGAGPSSAPASQPGAGGEQRLPRMGWWRASASACSNAQSKGCDVATCMRNRLHDMPASRTPAGPTVCSPPS